MKSLMMGFGTSEVALQYQIGPFQVCLLDQ